MEILSVDHILTGVKAETWQQAVEAAGQILVDQGSITSEYIENMIQAVNELGPYMVLMPHFALAHAAPCAAGLHDDMSLIILDEPVTFGSPNDPVKVILCLACTDKESHMNALTRVAGALMEETVFDALMEASTAEEAYEALNSFQE
ncbi:MAG: PTS sugar transporter subunit IIA [Erysipelotrichaceae bacterium]|nr:PTS sugar transporter subunit IIA [Erysipelotrichaceae bacterium]